MWEATFSSKSSTILTVAVTSMFNGFCGDLKKTVKDVLALPDVKQRLLDMGIEARPSTPDELMRLFKADVKKWDDVIVKAGIEKK